MKPWLIMTKEEKKSRQAVYELYVNSCCQSGFHDEVFEIMLKPPDTEIEAILELYLWQLRKRD